MKFWDKLMAAVATKDEAGIKALVLQARDEAEKEETEEAKKKEEAKDKALDARLATITDSLPKMISDAVSKAVADCMKEIADKAKDEEEKEEKEEKETEDKAKDEEEEEEVKQEAGDKAKDHARVTDSALLEDQFNAVKSAAEIIAPGVQFPTFDRAADPRKTVKDCICALRQRALVQGLGDSATAGFISTVNGKAIDADGIKALKCADARVLFNSVAALKKQHNSAATMSAADAGKTADKSPMDKFLDASRAMRNHGTKK